METIRIAAEIKVPVPLMVSAAPKTPLNDYGIKRVVTNHYLLATSGSPLALVMNRRIFEALPKPVREILRKYSGEWAAARFIESYDRSDELALEQLKSDPKRKLVLPSSSDQDRAQTAFKSAIADSGWRRSLTIRYLLKMVESEVGQTAVDVPATTQ